MFEWVIAALLFLAMLVEWFIIEWLERRKRG